MNKAKAKKIAGLVTVSMGAPSAARLLLLLALIATVGCGATAESGLPTTSMQIGSKTYTLEIAANDKDREHGLMERDTLPRDHGMIFIFTVPQQLAFWMHHTRFPLDIIYADGNARIVSIKSMKAYDETSIPSDGESKYAIELNAGEAATTGVKPGDRLQLPDTVLNTAVK
jgi:uncharacterized membrane protein (UPF0127 family)